jgi:hypothetical protein
MTTECNAREFDFQALGSRAVTARFDGGAITSDAGGTTSNRSLWKRSWRCIASLPRKSCSISTPPTIRRGEMENRIKEQQLCLFADRTSCATMRANQLRLWLSSVAYTFLAALRQFGLQGTEMAQARCDTIRLKLLKLGALVRTTVRRVWISLSESCPYQRVFAQVYENLRRWSLPLPASG